MKHLDKYLLSAIMIFIGIVFLIECLIIRFSDSRVASMLAIFFLNVAIIAFVNFENKKVEKDINSFIRNANEQSKSSLTSTLEMMPVGVLRYTPKTYDIEWFNPYVDLIFGDGKQDLDKKQIKSIVEQLDDGFNKFVTLGDKKYSVRQDTEKHLLYFSDVTGEYGAKISVAETRPVIGVISVDNYDDVTDLISESERTAVNSIITNSIDSMADKYKIFTRRVSSDRYYFFTDYKTLSIMMKDKFSFSDTFRKSAAERNVSLTYSIGIGYGFEDFQSIGKTALNNLELALVRGGDQVVVKENTKSASIRYFGGNSASKSQRSRTRARAVSTALSTIISESDNVFIVGHKYPDMDALGSSLGMKIFSNLSQKDAYIVYDKSQLLPDVKRAIVDLKKYDDGEKYILPLDKAKSLKKANSLLIMVDHSKSKMTLNKDFYESFDKVVVIDHHRRDEDFPEHAMMTYIESGASSASELATELIQYLISDSKKMIPVEASVILAGISVDTKSFSKGATSRTFEAASFLRSQGADSNLIKNILATDFEEYKSVNEIVLNADFVAKNIIIASGDDSKKYDSVTTAIAAETLVDMAGMDMSFAITNHDNGYVAISARSRGDYNVQSIMSDFGGGGHFNNAAAQIYEKSVDQVKKELIKILKKDQLIPEKDKK
jgi:Predicted signaling protein consisting of a modified GGDEF domain and a DHH domain